MGHLQETVLAMTEKSTGNVEARQLLYWESLKNSRGPSTMSWRGDDDVTAKSLEADLEYQKARARDERFYRMP